MKNAPIVYKVRRKGELRDRVECAKQRTETVAECYT